MRRRWACLPAPSSYHMLTDACSCMYAYMRLKCKCVKAATPTCTCTCRMHADAYHRRHVHLSYDLPTSPAVACSCTRCPMRAALGIVCSCMPLRHLRAHAHARMALATWHDCTRAGPAALQASPPWRSAAIVRRRACVRAPSATSCATPCSGALAGQGSLGRPSVCVCEGGD